jgi:hypothetical protein
MLQPQSATSVALLDYQPCVASAEEDQRDDPALVLPYETEQGWRILAFEGQTALVQRFACFISYLVAAVLPRL